jgi:hypothetical protein
MFDSAGSTDASGEVREVGQSVDTASFGVGFNGVTFAISDFELKRGISDTAIVVYQSVGSSVFQKVSLGNGIEFKRACVLTMSISARR